MTNKSELLRLYEETTAASRTILGFEFNKAVYMVILNTLNDAMVELTNESSARGGELKLRLKLNKTDKAKLRNKAIKVGTTEILETVKGNKGDSWEKWVAEHYGIEWSKSNESYNKNGDITVCGEKLQVKWENATLAKASTILKAAGLA